MNYSKWTVCNLPSTDANGLTSPDILFIVNVAIAQFNYSKQILSQQRIIRFQKGSAIARYWAYTAVLCSSAHTRHSNLVPRAALRKMTSQNYTMVSKINSDESQRTPVCPARSQDACILVNNKAFYPYQNYSENKWITAIEPYVTYRPQTQTA